MRVGGSSAGAAQVARAQAALAADDAGGWGAPSNERGFRRYDIRCRRGQVLTATPTIPEV